MSKLVVILDEALYSDSILTMLRECYWRRWKALLSKC